MKAESMDAQRRRKVFLVVCGAGLLALVGFAIANYIGSNVLAMWTDIVMAAIIAGAVLALRLGIEDRKVYRLAGWGICIGLCCLVAIGSTLLHFHLVLPLLMLFFLGRRAGMVWAGVFLFGITVLMLAPGLVGSHVYPTGNTMRFFVGYLFVTLVGWSYERSRERFHALLATQNERLQREKEQLKDALSQIRETKARLERTTTELQDKTQLMETVFNSISDGVVAADENGKYFMHNSSAEKIGNHPLPERIDIDQRPEEYGLFRPDKETFFPVDELPLTRALRGEATDDIEIFMRNESRPKGVYLNVSGRPLQPAISGVGVKGGVAVFHDITKLKQTEARLEQTIAELQDKTQLMETVFNSVSDGVVVTDTDGRFLLVNPRAESIVGMGATDTPSEQWSETYGTFYPDKETPFPSQDLPLMRAMRGETSNDTELFIRNPERPQGVYISVNARPLRDDAGMLKGGVIVLRDITKLKDTETELKQTADSLRDQVQLMETVFNSISDGVIATNEKRELLVWNSSAERISGIHQPLHDSDQWAEKYGIYHPDGKTLVTEEGNPLVRIIRGESIDDIELLVRNEQKPDGVSVSVSGRPLKGKGGITVGSVVVFRDITQVKQTQAKLEGTITQLQSQTRLMETIFKGISDGVVAADENGNFTIFNPSAERIVGIGMTNTGPDQWSEQYGVFFPDRVTTVPTDELPLTRAIRGEASDDMEMFIRNPKIPQGVHISVSGRPLRDDSGMTKGGVIVFRDVTKLKETEHRLQQTADNLRDQARLMETVLKSISDGVIAADEKGKFLIINPSAERITGIGVKDKAPSEWPAPYGVFFPDRVTTVPTDDLPLVRAIRGEASDEMEMFIRNPKIPEGVYVSVSGRPLQDYAGTMKGGVVVFRDVTERLRAEEALTQAFAQGRLEILDTILHNIGNAINSVTIGVGTIHEQLVKNELVNRFSALVKALEAHRDDWVEYLQTDPQGQKVMPFILALAEDFARQNAQFKQTVERVGSRVAHIVDIIRTQRSLDSGTMARKDVNLRKAINDAVKLLQDSLTQRGVQIRLDCQNAPQEIRIQESKFHQMLVNLIKNSMEAIDDLAKSGGLEAKPCIQIQSYIYGDFLFLDVIDNGIGIEPKRSKLIFTAGYTTKEKGSGLGLHSAANFVIGFGGQIYPLSTSVGKGTTMRIKLRLSAVAVTSKNAGGGGDYLNIRPDTRK